MEQTLSNPIDAFHQAIETAGGQAAFAKICGCTQGNISQLKLKGSLLPPQYVLAVEGAGLGVTRYDLRPDIYPREISRLFPNDAKETNPIHAATATRSLDDASTGQSDQMSHEGLAVANG